MFENIYQNYLFKYPKLFFFLISIFMLVMLSFALKLEIDASAETLLLEGDKDLEYTREISKRFEAPDFLVVTYTVQGDLLSQNNIQSIRQLSKQIHTLSIVESITNITNVPLLQSPVKPIKELIEKIPTLQSKNIDKNLVKQEFLTSAIYKQNLVSADFKTTAIMVNLKKDTKYYDLIDTRDSFLKLQKTTKLNIEQVKAYDLAKLELKKYRDILRIQTHNNIKDIRKIIETFKSSHPNIKLHLGGASMIADDMVEFVKYDLKTFGVVIVLLLVVILFVLFREIKWVLIPLLICTVSIIITSGFLGFFGWEITVISSNFISLQLIMNMSLVVHLIIKYKELNTNNQNLSQKELIYGTLSAMAKPSFFVVITTIAGFSSLVFSNILPIITFGWMMSVGIVVSLIVTFILFPLFLLFFTKSELKNKEQNDIPFTLKVAKKAYNYKKTIIFSSLAVIIFSVSGATKLRVENSFIDYFKHSTEIYKGMKLIDQKLGGTTPLDILITFKESSDEIEDIQIVSSDEDEELDSFDDEFDLEESSDSYWFTASKMEKIKQVHNYMQSHDSVGKVLSLATITQIGKILNEGVELDGLTLALLYKELPEEYKKIIISPYVDLENNMARISTRIIDSKQDLKRDELLKQINKDLKQLINPKYEEVKVTNLLVIYNNMLQSLFDSQIKTIGIVIFILFVMFMVLFKNLKIALVAMIANVVPVSVIFGFMGWMDIPLDMMTITIAAISIGIAVDNTIHYIHRFKTEINAHEDYKEAMYNSHKSIGTAMFYTSSIIMIGFSILILSNFIPTIYFGILTMIAMFMAILADLLLLPILLILFRCK